MMPWGTQGRHDVVKLETFFLVFAKVTSCDLLNVTLQIKAQDRNRKAEEDVYEVVISKQQFVHQTLI